MKKIIMLAALAFVEVGCSTTKPLYNWKGYDDAVYSYTKNSDTQSIEALIKIYTQLIETPQGSRNVPPPGVCADYGYLLLKGGDVQRGKTLLAKETQLYPESKPFIDRILKRFDK